MSLPNSVCGNATPYFISAAPLRGRCQGGQQPLVGQAWFALVGVESLEADVIGPRRPVLVDPPANRCDIAPGDQRVDQVIGAAVGEVRRREAEAQQVLAVVRQLEVATEPVAADAARARRIGI